MRADTAQRLENAFEEAIDQLLAGEAAEADRRAKALSALVRARRRSLVRGQWRTKMYGGAL